LLKTNNTFDLYIVKLRNPPVAVVAHRQLGTWALARAAKAKRLSPTIASARFPENPATYTSLTVNSDLLYTTYNGQDVLALIAQNNINVGLYSANVEQIDAALVAKNGRVGRYYYNSNCGSSYVRSTLTLNGMIATNQRYGFAYTDGTGYTTRNLNYDTNLLYNPPPSFPLTSNQYTLISWEEIH
jgi:hypothetical protein